MFDRVWEEIHAKREWGRYPKEELVRWVIRSYGSVPERSDIRFLDLGCGAGASSWFLAREGFRVVAFDGSASAIARVTDATERVVGDAINLPFKDGSFDAVIDIVCVAHNPPNDARRIISEVARVLRPGGRVFSALPAVESDPEAYENKGHITFYSLSATENLFRTHFKDIQIGYTLTFDGVSYTKLWFVQAIVKENCNG